MALWSCSLFRLGTKRGLLSKLQHSIVIHPKKCYEFTQIMKLTNEGFNGGVVTAVR